MTDIRIAHISDTHLGYRALFRSTPDGRNQRAVDIERAYQTVVDDVLDRQVDLVLHSGDVFHHSRPTYPAIRTFIQQTRRLCAAGIPVVVIAGNHDTPRLRTSGTVFDIVALALTDCTFVTGYDLETVVIEGLDVAVTAVPHGRLTDGETPELTPRPGAINILTTHGLVNGLDVPGVYHEPGEQRLDDALFSPEYEYIALGHIHQHYRPRATTAMWYSGSTERIGWNDREIRPGYTLVEVARGGTPLVTPIPIETARQMIQLGAIEGDGKGAREIADAILHSTSIQARATAMARVELRGVDRSVRREVESIIRREHAAVVWSLQVTAPASDAISAFGAADGVSVETALASLPTLFDEFVAGRSYSDDFRDRFRTRGLRAIDEARAALNESAGATE